MENPDFLKAKYDLHNAPEVDSAVKRTESRTGEKLPRDPETPRHASKITLIDLRKLLNGVTPRNVSEVLKQ